MPISEGCDIAAQLEREGVGLTEVSHGVTGKQFRKVSRGKESRPIPEAYLLDDARRVRTATLGVLAVVGGFRSPAVMEEVIDSGTADMIALCRPLIRQPDLVRRWCGGSRETADCVSCAACIKPDKQGGACIEYREINMKVKRTAAA